jgi:AcrR family transcriptional regulator
VTQTAPTADLRTPLSRERVLGTAVDLADRGGIEAISMRKLGQELGVEAMALYRHVRSKNDILDGIVDVVVGGIEVPRPADDWKTAMRELAMAARQVMLLHAWVPPVLVERSTVGPATLRHLDAVMGILASGGFSIEMAHHALHVLGSRVLGFTQDPFDDSADARPDAAATAAMAQALAANYPHLGALASAVSHDGGLGGCDDDFEFAFGLDLILDGLERQRTAAA